MKKVDIRRIPEFSRRAKILAKKYKSFSDDYKLLLKSLREEPYQGVSLGAGVYKVRMAIASKGRGKSGGARVLTFHVEQKDEDVVEITLLTIYDKSEMENVSDAYIRQIINVAKDY